MSNSEEILKKVFNNMSKTSQDIGSIDSFRNSSMEDVTWSPNNDLFKSAGKVVKKASNNQIFTIAMMLGAGLILKNGRFMKNAASNMRNYLENFYSAGAGKLTKFGLVAKEGLIGASKGTRKLRDVNINLAKQQVGLEPGIKQSLDEIIGAKNTLISNPSNWKDGNMLKGGILKDTAYESMKFLDKKLLGEMNNAFALSVRKEGLSSAMQSPLHNVIKPVVSYKKYSKKSGGFRQLANDMKIKDKEVLTTGLGAWNMGLKNAIKTRRLNVANFKETPLQNATQDIQMSREGTLSFRAYKSGLMKPKTKITDLRNYFISNGYRATDNKSIFKIGKGASEKSIVIRKTNKGTTHIQFSPSRKTNYHWGGFNGNLVFNDKLHKGKVGVFGTDVYDIGGDSIVGLRKTPLLNVSNVKEINVPVIKAKKAPVFNDKVSKNSYNRKVKIAEESLEEVKSRPYGIKETKEHSQDVEEYFGLLKKAPSNRPDLKRITRLSTDFNNSVNTYYKLYTKVTMGKATPEQLRDFRKAKAILGLEVGGPAAATAVGLGAYSFLKDDD